MLRCTTGWFKYDRDYLCVNKSQFVPVIFEPPCTLHVLLLSHFILMCEGETNASMCSVIMSHAMTNLSCMLLLKFFG
jgi:hypothetical protein